ncbi:tetratricopeptide repeat protein, partial [bacterium]|nr:tetratricopeptide repeat protein [bacterium]
MLRWSAILFLTFLFTFGLEGCAKRATVKPESVVDTPENHYSLGIKLTEEGKTDAAAEEFNRAMNLDPKFAPAYAGMAILDALKGDFRSAHRMVESGLDYESEDTACLIAKGRVFTMEKAGDKWLERALEAFDRVLKRTPEHSEALFYRAEAFKHAHKFSEAGEVYSTVVAKKDNWSARANREWELVQKIVRAAPATQKGNEIALIPAIDRADLAVLLLEELKLKD